MPLEQREGTSSPAEILSAGNLALTTLVAQCPTVLATPAAHHWLYAMQTMAQHFPPEVQDTDQFRHLQGALASLLPPPPPEVLRLAFDFALPLDTLTRTLGIFAMKGAGKSYCSGVLIEELTKQGQLVTVIDPLGVYWGLRSSADGEHAGLPILIFGGRHGDLPLPPTSGKLMARLLLEMRQPAILDLSLMKDDTEQQQFVASFIEGFREHEEILMHIVLDEADLFAPQTPRSPVEFRSLNAVDTLIRRWRYKGIGATLITQRPTVLNKNETDNLEALVVLRITSPRDTKAFQEWFKHATKEQREQFVSTLPGLPNGVAWIWSPEWLKTFRLVYVRQKETFDSSVTPRVGVERRAPRQLAEINLEALQQHLTALTEQAQNEDPVLLRARIAELERRLAESGDRSAKNRSLGSSRSQDLTHLTDQIAQLQEEKRQLQEQLTKAEERPTALESPKPTGADSANVQEGQRLRQDLEEARKEITRRDERIAILEEQIRVLAHIKVSLDGTLLPVLDLPNALKLDTMHVAQASFNAALTELPERPASPHTVTEEAHHAPESLTREAYIHRLEEELGLAQRVIAEQQEELARLKQEHREPPQEASVKDIDALLTPVEQRVRWKQIRQHFLLKDPVERLIVQTLLAYEQREQQGLTVEGLALLLERSPSTIRRHLPDRLVRLKALSLTQSGSSHTLYYRSRVRAYLRGIFDEHLVEPLFTELLQLLEAKNTNRG